MQKTYIERLNGTVPDNVCSEPGRASADDDVIVNRDAFGPEHLALIGTLVCVVFQANGRGMAIGRIGAQVAVALVLLLPVRGRNYICAGAVLGSSSGFCPIVAGWRRGRGSRFKARRLHSSTVAGWAGGASDKKVVGVSKEPRGGEG